MAHLVIRQMIEPKVEGDPRTLEQRVAHWERALVGQLAREAHGRGEQFIDWPECKLTEDDLFPTGLVLSVEVDTKDRS